MTFSTVLPCVNPLFILLWITVHDELFLIEREIATKSSSKRNITVANIQIYSCFNSSRLHNVWLSFMSYLGRCEVRISRAGGCVNNTNSARLWGSGTQLGGNWLQHRPRRALIYIVMAVRCRNWGFGSANREGGQVRERHPRECCRCRGVRGRRGLEIWSVKSVESGEGSL